MNPYSPKLQIVLRMTFPNGTAHEVVHDVTEQWETACFDSPEVDDPRKWFGNRMREVVNKHVPFDTMYEELLNKILYPDTDETP